MDVLHRHNIDISGTCSGGPANGPIRVRITEDYVDTIYGDGVSCCYCRVEIPTKFHHLLPEQFQEEKIALKRVWDEHATVASRLSCQITIEKKHDGLIVLVPDPAPYYMP